MNTMNTQSVTQICIDEEASIRFASLLSDFMARSSGKAA